MRLLLLPLLLLGALWGADKTPLVPSATGSPQILQPSDRLRIPFTGPFYHTFQGTATADRLVTLPDASLVLAGSAVAGTSGRVPYYAAGGLLTDSALFTHSTGTLTLGDATNAGGIAIGGASGAVRSINVVTSGGLTRWGVFVRDATDDYRIRAYDDAGVAIDYPLTMARAAGGSITFGRPTTQATNWSQTGATTFSTGTGAVTLNGDVVVTAGKTLLASTGVTLDGSGFSATTNLAYNVTRAGHTSGANALRLSNNAGSDFAIIGQQGSSANAIAWATANTTFVYAPTRFRVSTGTASTDYLEVTAAGVAHAGTGTFSTGTGAVSMNGLTTVTVGGGGSTTASGALKITAAGSTRDAVLQMGTAWTAAKFDSQGTAWASRTIGAGLIFNQGAADRPEISWYRGGNTYPEFSIREHTTANIGGEIWAGSGSVAPSLVMTFASGSVGVPNGNVTLAATGSGTGTVKVYTNAARNAFVARFNDANSQGGFYISSSGECYFATNNDIAGGVDTYSRATIPPARWGNPQGASTFPFVVQYAAAGASGAAITWTTGLSIGVTGSVVLGSAALTTTATDGFLYIPTCPGLPTGVPTAQTGRAPLVIDSTNNKLYFYSGGAWRDAGP